MDSGCETFFDITQYSGSEDGTTKLTDHVKQATSGGKGATAAVICTASNAAYAQAVRFLKNTGTLVCVGVPEGDVTPIIGADPGNFIAKQMKIFGSAVGNRTEALQVLDFAARGLIKTHVVVEKLDDLNDVFHRMAKGQLHGRTVIDLTT